MLAELERHPHALAVLRPALDVPAAPSHAYLFHGPGGAGKRAAARALAAELLAEGSANPESARHRVLTGAHPDLTWVVPSGAHEILVSDIDGPVIAAATRTPFESRRRVFVIERADELGEEAANRMLKTLEEPPSYVHLILLTDRVGEILPTIRSRCQAVRFEAPSELQAVTELRRGCLDEATAVACVRLALQDADRAAELADAGGQALRAAAEGFARAAVSGQMAQGRPWEAVMTAVKGRGEAVAAQLEGRAQAELELLPRREHKRARTEWDDRIRRGRRRAATGALDLTLQIVALWFGDLFALALDAPDLVRNADRPRELAADAGCEPRRLRAAIELAEETRQRLLLNVSEELACEALGYRLQEALGR